MGQNVLTQKSLNIPVKPNVQKSFFTDLVRGWRSCYGRGGAQLPFSYLIQSKEHMLTDLTSMMLAQDMQG